MKIRVTNLMKLDDQAMGLLPDSGHARAVMYAVIT